jgi:hypothetical protein
MKKIILAVLSLLVVVMFLVGCAQEEVSEEELETELSELSAEELDQAIETVETEDSGALAGQAYFRKIPSKFSKVPKDRFLKSAYKTRLTKLEQKYCYYLDSNGNNLPAGTTYNEAKEENYIGVKTQEGESLNDCDSNNNWQYYYCDIYGIESGTNVEKFTGQEICPYGCSSEGCTCGDEMGKYYLAEWDDKGYCGTPNTDYCLDHHVYVPEPSGSLGMGSECTMVWMAEEMPGSAGDIIGGYVCSVNPNDMPPEDFMYAWEYPLENSSIPCGSSGAEHVGGGGSAYCCAYTE